MRHVLILCLALGLGLAGCSRNTAKDAADAALPGVDAAAMAGLGADVIEVTPLDGPGAVPAGPQAADDAAAIGAAALAAQAAAPAPAPDAAPRDALPGPAAATVPVAAADAGTPHPAARPATDAGADTGADADSAAEEGSGTETLALPEPPKSQPQLLCEASGGLWGQAPDSGAFLCQKPTRDSGKSCTRKSDCQGECLARSGTCAPVMPLLGCNEVLDSEGRLVTLCIN